MPAAPPLLRPARRLIGYARVSTDEQATDAQLDELRAAGCGIVHEEHGSGASRARPVLAKLMREIKKGDVLVVVRLDRLARSVSHLLQVIETLEERGAHFKSLRDPIDTSTPQGMFSLQVLGAVAQLERALIAERTRAGIKAAKARGRLPGNPGLREKRGEAIRAVAAARDRVYLGDLINAAPSFLPIVQRMRPQHWWGDVVRVLEHKGQSWTVERLRRLVRERLASPELIERAPRRPPEDRLMTLVAGSRHETLDGEHGRLETRRYTAFHDIDWLKERHNWPGLEGVVMVESQREINDKHTIETRFYITSLTLGADLVGPMIRDHWAIENSLHWVMDMVFRDDECRVRTENAPANFTTLKHMANNLIHKAPGKDSQRLKRMTAAWDDDFLASLVAA